jgi:uncharacterized protein YlxW (UPF0749 family)
MSGGQWMVVLIVLIAVIGSVLKKPRDGRRRGAEVDHAENARLRNEVRQLKDRIQVLERVVTDNHGSIGLEREIDRLRDR